MPPRTKLASRHTHCEQKQLTHRPYGHILTNIHCWSADGQWVYYDVRSDPAGTVFDGSRIERVNVETGEIDVVYEAQLGAKVGVVTTHPSANEILFIHGPELPDATWQYCAYHRRGVQLKLGVTRGSTSLFNLDACCVDPPFIAGALRGGSHVHTFDPTGKYVAFTYEDHVLANFNTNEPHDLNQRNVGVSVLGYPVRVPNHHLRNHSGESFSVLVTQTVNHPIAGSDEISRAYEDAWVGRSGYVRSDGVRVPHALAFLGDVKSASGENITELFVVDLPDDLTRPGPLGPLEGTTHRRPAPPYGCQQRRLTFTADRAYPGIQGPRHWPRSTPDGKQIVVLMRDERGCPQLHLISTFDQSVRALTHLEAGIESAFTISADGNWIAHVSGGEVCMTVIESGECFRLTDTPIDCDSPRPEACVFHPTRHEIAFVRPVRSREGVFNQIFVAKVA